MSQVMSSDGGVFRVLGGNQEYSGGTKSTRGEPRVNIEGKRGVNLLVDTYGRWCVLHSAFNRNT